MTGHIYLIPRIFVKLLLFITAFRGLRINIPLYHSTITIYRLDYYVFSIDFDKAFKLVLSSISLKAIKNLSTSPKSEERTFLTPCVRKTKLKLTLVLHFDSLRRWYIWYMKGVVKI